MANDAETIAERSIRECLGALAGLLEPDRLALIDAAAELICDALANGSKLLLFGNGGSASDAAHIAAEFIGRFQSERRALPAIALSTNLAALTAIGNDYGFDWVFSRQLEALARPGDVAVGISTSGMSANVLEGVRAARRLGVATIGLTGADGGDLAAVVDLCLRVPSESTARTQEGHILLGHTLCEIVECRIV